MKKSRLLGAVCAFILSAPVNASLVGRLPDVNGNYQAYYDDLLDITWSLYSFHTQPGHWGNTLSHVSSFSIDGITGWRLPSVDKNGDKVIETCRNGNTDCLDNEFSHQYYINGISSERPGVFTDVRTVYWSKDYYGNGLAHVFYISDRVRGTSTSSTNGAAHGWAVHDGDVGIVPIPPAVWLFGSGLLALIGMARKEPSRTHAYTTDRAIQVNVC